MAILYPNIEAERARKGMSIETIAAQIGISRKTYYNWIVRGRISQKKAEFLADFFDVSIDYLLQRTDNEPESEPVQMTSKETQKSVIEKLKRM